MRSADSPPSSAPTFRVVRTPQRGGEALSIMLPARDTRCDSRSRPTCVDAHVLVRICLMSAGCTRCQGHRRRLCEPENATLVLGGACQWPGLELIAARQLRALCPRAQQLGYTASGACGDVSEWHLSASASASARLWPEKDGANRMRIKGVRWTPGVDGRGSFFLGNRIRSEITCTATHRSHNAR